MVRILYIGQYEETGKFITNQWKCFIEWCRIECNKLIVYTQMSYSSICDKFPLYCVIKELRLPDETLSIYAYEINIVDDAFWDYIQDYNYSIDVKDDISHIFFFYGKRNIASLEIVDFENYLLIEEPISEESKFLLERELILENLQFCAGGKSDIEELMQGEKWKPLGCD